MKRNYILTFIGIILVAGAYFGAKKIVANKKKPKAKPEKIIKTVFVDTVKNTAIPINLLSNGSLVAKKRLEIYAEVQGVFKTGKKLLRAGQAYNKGERLITIDNSEYRASVKSAKSNLYNLITSIMPDLRLDYPEIYPKWNAYLNSFDINKRMPDLPETSSDKERYFITGKQIYSTYYDIENLQQRLSKYYLNAPFKGVLTEANVTEGTLIRSGQKLGTFIHTGSYEMEVQIPKAYINILEVGKSVMLSNLENTQKYSAKVSRINASVDQATQSATAFVEVNNNDLKEGMYLQAELTAKEETEAIEISRSLLLENNEIYTVTNGNTLSKIKVDPVFYGEKNVVLKNVPNGTLIISKNVPNAYAGMPVKIYHGNKNTTVESTSITKTSAK